MAYEMIQPAPAAAAGPPHASVRSAPDADAELVGRWQAGDAAAFGELVERHQRSVYRLAYRMLGDAAEAEDVAQEAFLRLHRHGGRFRGDARFSTFVYRVVANAALNRRRTLGRARRRIEALASRGEGFDRPAPPRDPEDAARGAQDRSRVQRALLEVPPDLRLALLLVEIEGLPYREAARALRVPEGTVKSRVHRGRVALRELLRDAAGGESGGTPGEGA